MAAEVDTVDKRERRSQNLLNQSKLTIQELMKEVALAGQGAMSKSSTILDTTSRDDRRPIHSNV